MKKTISIFTLIFALLLTTGCTASNAAQEPMEARIIDVQPAANPAEEVVDEQTEAPTEAPTEKPSDEPTAIGKDKALQIALDHAGVSSKKAANVVVEYDKEDKEYEVDFRAGDYEYDYTIAAYSGKIRSHDKEYDPIETKPKDTQPKETQPKETSLIGKDKAKSIALKHAGFSAGDVTGLQVEYDKDDGVPVYEVEFNKDRKEYTYEIYGETGKILSWEIDD